MPRAAVDPDVDEFLDEIHWSAPVRRHAASKLAQWTVWLGDVAPLTATHRHLRAYLEQRQGAGIAPATRRKDWQMIRAFYTWAATPVRDGGAGLLAADPMQRVRPPHVPSRPTTRAAKPEEVAALEEYFDAIGRSRRDLGERERARRNVAMISLMFRSGCRVGELPFIDLDDVFQRNGHCAIRLHADHTKTAEGRILPVTAETQRYLNRYLRMRGPAPGPLFRGRRAHTADPYGRLTVNAIQIMVYRAAKRLAIPVSPHQLRRGFTSQYLRSGGDVLSLEVVGGWADHRMPRRYLADEETDAALDRFHAVVDSRPVGRRRTATR